MSLRDIITYSVIIGKGSPDAVTANVSAKKVGWDLTSRPPKAAEGKPIREDRLIEVKGRAKGADAVTLTHNEICTAVNLKGQFILAIVLVDGETTDSPYYVTVTEESLRRHQEELYQTHLAVCKFELQIAKIEN